MIKMPDDLAATAHLVDHEPLTLDEDHLNALSNDLSRGGHLFGPKYLKVFGAHLYLPGVQGAYGKDVDADFATVDALREHLRQLNQRTQASIDAQAKIIEQAGAALDRVAGNAAQATSVLPDGPLTVSSGAPSTYEHWVEFGR